MELKADSDSKGAVIFQKEEERGKESEREEDKQIKKNKKACGT